MDLGEHLATLPSLQRAAVTMVYFEGRTAGEAAVALTIERSAVTAALGAAYRTIADWVCLDEPVSPETTAPPSRIGVMSEPDDVPAPWSPPGRLHGTA